MPHQDDERNFHLQLPYLYNLGVNSHFEGHTGAEGKTEHSDPAAKDLRMLLQDSIGCLQQENRRKTNCFSCDTEARHFL